MFQEYLTIDPKLTSLSLPHKKFDHKLMREHLHTHLHISNNCARFSFIINNNIHSLKYTHTHRDKKNTLIDLQSHVEENKSFHIFSWSFI